MSNFNKSTFSGFVLLLLEYQFIVTLWLKCQSEETGIDLNPDYINFNANNLYTNITYCEIQEDLERHRDYLFKKLFS